MKKLLLALLGALLFLFGGCSSAPPRLIPEKGTPLRLLIASDTHYLSPELTDYGTAFLTAEEIGDGKSVHYGPQILDAFLAEALEQKPDALILCGDLAFTGAEQSHREIAQKLSAVQDAGIPVLLIPGNHDVNHPHAFRYSGDKTQSVDVLPEKEFSRVYGQLGGRDALSRDKDSASYVFPLTEDVRILLLDANTADYPEEITPSTLAWAEKQLQEAQEQGAEVFTVTHQNLLPHSPLFSEGYLIRNSNELIPLLTRYGVRVNFSGHMHTQHIAQNEAGFYDIAAGSLSMYPNLYAVVELDEKRNLSYHTHSVNVSSWAAAQGLTDPNLLNFPDYAKKLFDRVSNRKMWWELAELDLTEEEATEMGSAAIKLNGAYFAGRVPDERDAFLQSRGYRLWMEKGSETFFGKYLFAILEQTPKDENSLWISSGSG